MLLRPRTGALRALALLAGALLCQQSLPAAPTITITNLPAYGTTNDLFGVVSGIAPSEARVAVFTYSASAGWNTKPYCNNPLTVIQADGSWRTDITTGGADSNATRIAALLVSTNYSQPCVQGASSIPTNLFAQAFASTVLTRPSPGVRWLNFSGYDWWVKNSTGPVGPGPNYFSNSTNNVWLDAAGQLHLRITYRANQWQCAELIGAQSFGYGTYRFTLNSRVDNFNPRIVLGLFTYSDDPNYNYRELDIECSRWSKATDTNNAQFVVQPSRTGQKARFAMPTELTNSMLSFTWETNKVSFESLRGPTAPNPGTVISNWTCKSGIPLNGDETVRLNLWLHDGLPPTDSNEVEVILQNFTFLPLGAPGSSLAALPCYDDLPGDYTEAGNLGAPNCGDETWSLLSTPGGVTNLLVTTNAALSYPGLVPPPDGSRGVAVAYTNALYSAGINFNAVSNGSLYASFLLKVTALPAAGNTRCLVGLSSSTTYANTPDLTLAMTSGGKLCVARKTIGPPTSSLSSALTLGQTYLVVLRYNFVPGATNDTVDLWLNPSPFSFGATEANVPTPTIAGYFDAAVPDPSSLVAFFIPAQQSSAKVERWCLDEFRLGMSWSDVTPSSGQAGKLELPVSLGGSSFRLNFLGAAGTKYALDWASNLATPVQWSAQLTNTAPFNGLMTYTNSRPCSRNFWRTRSVP